MMRKVLILGALCLCGLTARGQYPGWEAPLAASVGCATLRHEFVSYTTRQDAEAGDRLRAVYYKEIALQPTGRGVYVGQADLQFRWRGQQVFLRVEGLPQAKVSFNGHEAGMVQDSRVFSEIDVTQLIVEGRNTLTLTAEEGYGALMETIPGARATVLRAALMGQPVVRVEDYAIEGRYDAAAGSGTLHVAVSLHNAASGDESFELGYDIFSSESKLIHYDLRGVTLKGGARDTLRFEVKIRSFTAADVWRVGSPKLFRGTMYIKYGGRNVEYVPYTVGFVSDGAGWDAIRGAVPSKCVRFNAEPTRQATEKRLTELRRGGTTLLCVDYPQPVWFYDLCDRVGMMVVDQANVNAGERIGDRNIDGALSNDPRLVELFVRRVLAQQKRVAGHPCIVAWSLGGDCGVGYNMYMAYLALKAADGRLPVLYRGAGGEWNNDLPFAFPR